MTINGRIELAAFHFTDPAEEPTYRRWIDAHPHGFVLNTRKIPSEEYLILHRTGSPCLAWQNPLRAYSKLCGDRADIDHHVARIFRIDPRAIHGCANCFGR
jgi:hypothetical protein